MERIKKPSLGTLALMEKLECGLLNGSEKLEDIIQYIYIHSVPISETARLQKDELSIRALEFCENLSTEDLAQCGEWIEEDSKAIQAAKFVTGGKKK